MLPRKKRIPKTEFPSFKNKGTRFSTTFFSGTVYPSLGGSRVSVVVSKKVAKSAVVRNRLRRQFYAAVAPHLDNFNKAVLLVLYPKQEAAKTEPTLIRTEMKESFKKINLLSK